MVKRSGATIPDAWDDDWEAQADQPVKEEVAPEPPAPKSKADRMAQHAETNRKIWESA
jgi:hypothetical protein